MKRVIVPFLGIVMLLMFGCTKQVDTQTDIQALKNSLEEFEIAVNASDFETLASFYTEDAVRMPPNEPALVGNEAIRTGSKKGFEKYDYELEISTEEVRVVGDWAFMRGVSAVTITPKTGGKPIQGTSKWMAFRQRQSDGSWKIVSDIYNSDSLPPENTN